ncbi:alanine dehydrogenase [Salinibius halmophilus]|uniref:alanine dehydrogenase n=1 Tax=Salinibius halmophilus TaxID=1853216 RepID=UPI000E6643CC|nr:alanine dehydrogenase [Salinibius halmophilus]
MIIGVPKEIKNHEYRVAVTPSGAQQLVKSGHTVLVEAAAGERIGFRDQDYLAAGANILFSAQEVFAQAELIVKVKEPQPEELALLKPHHTLFTYLHLAASQSLTKGMQASGCTGIAYETITNHKGELPLLAPMSAIAGRLAAQAGAFCLQTANGGRGVLMGGVPGTLPANIAIIGAGVVGQNAAAMAVGLGGDVTVFDLNVAPLQKLDSEYKGRVKTCIANEQVLANALRQADLVIGAVLVPGASAPKIITDEMIASMPNGSAFVDVAIDQGGCSTTSKATTHDQPTYVVDGVVHYCVANMPAAAARTATDALTNQTLPFVQKLADLGIQQALAEDKHLANGLNVAAGKLMHPAVIAAMQ